MKKVVSLFIIIALMIGAIMPIAANAEQKIYYYSDTGSFNAEVMPDGNAKLTGNINNTFTLERVVVPAYIEGHKVTELGPNCLSSLKAKTLELPDSITVIGKSACQSCSIESIKLPSMLVSLGAHAFAFCKSLKTVVFPAGLTTISENAFSGCALEDVQIPDSVVSIGDYAFYENNISAINLGHGTQTIGKGAFYKHKLEEVVIPENVKTIMDSAFSSDTIKRAKIYNPSCTLSNFAVFYNRNNVKVTIFADSTGIRDYCKINTSYYVFYYLNPAVKSVKLKTTAYSYDGKYKKPSIVATDSNGVTISSKYYTVSYSANKNVGTAKAIVSFKGNYSGTKTVYFKIVPKGTSLSKLSSGKKSFTAKWKKQATQSTGYQLQYATNSKFSGAKTLTVKGTGKLSQTVKKLSAKKVYYVRIRTYKTISKVNYFSTWSKAYKVKTK